MSNIYDMADSWNDAGTTFTAIKMNVTDTASNAASLLLDLQVGGASRLTGTKAGAWRVGDGSASAPSLSFQNNTGNGFYRVTNAVIGYAHAGQCVFSWNTGYAAVQVASNWGFGFSSTMDGSGASDLFIRRDAANTLAQRNATNPQSSRIYNTYTDASNYERLSIGWSGNVVTIATQAAGTGTKRNIVLDGANRATYSETAADIAAALVAHGIMAPA